MGISSWVEEKSRFWSFLDRAYRCEEMKKMKYREREWGARGSQLGGSIYLNSLPLSRRPPAPQKNSQKKKQKTFKATEMIQWSTVSNIPPVALLLPVSLLGFPLHRLHSSSSTLILCTLYLRIQTTSLNLKIQKWWILEEYRRSCKNATRTPRCPA